MVICCAVSRASKAASKYTSHFGFSRKGWREWFIMSKTCMASWRSKTGIRADFHSGEFTWVLEMVWDTDSPCWPFCSLLQLTPPFSLMARLRGAGGDCKIPEPQSFFKGLIRLTADVFPECHHRCHRNLSKSRQPGQQVLGMYIPDLGGWPLEVLHLQASLGSLAGPYLKKI